MTHYFIFGSEVVEYLRNQPADKPDAHTVREIIGKGLDFDTFKYDEYTKPSELLDAFVGWEDYAEISEGFYKLIWGSRYF